MTRKSTPKPTNPEYTNPRKGFTLDALRAFSKLAHHKSGQGAATPLGNQARSLRRQARSVERHFGGHLFESGTFTLSTRGERVLVAVDRALEDFARLSAGALDDELPTLRIGYIRLMHPLVERALLALEQRDGKRFRVEYSELTSHAQVHALNVRKIDVAVCFDREELSGKGDKRDDARKDIAHTLLAQKHRYSLVVPERAYQNGQLSIDFLKELDYVYPRQPAVIAAGERWLRAQNLDPKNRIERDLATEMSLYAGSEQGFGFLPALWGVDNRARVAFVPVKNFPNAKISAYVMKPVSESAQRFTEQLRLEVEQALANLQ